MLFHLRHLRRFGRNPFFLQQVEHDFTHGVDLIRINWRVSASLVSCNDWLDGKSI